MRLIDTDKYLEKVCTYKETGCGSCKLQTMCPRDVPEVDAIPVEWIEKRMKEISEAMTHLYVEGCFYPKDNDYEERKNILLRQLAEIKLHGSAYDLVLNEWRIEKENDL